VYGWEERDTRVDRVGLGDGVVGVTGGEEYLEVGIGGLEPLCHYHAAHQGHDDIGNYQTKWRSLVIPRDAQRFLAVGSGEYFRSPGPPIRLGPDAVRNGSSSTTSRVSVPRGSGPVLAEVRRDGERLIDAWKADVESGAFRQ